MRFQKQEDALNKNRSLFIRLLRCLSVASVIVVIIIISTAFYFM